MADTQPEKPKRNIGQWIRLIVIIAIAVVIVILAVQNREQVETKLLVTTVTMPRALLIAVTGGIGFLAGMLTSWHMRRRRNNG